MSPSTDAGAPISKEKNQQEETSESVTLTDHPSKDGTESVELTVAKVKTDPIVNQVQNETSNAVVDHNSVTTPSEIHAETQEQIEANVVKQNARTEVTAVKDVNHEAYSSSSAFQAERIEPEGTTPIGHGNASRRFDDDILERIMEGGDGKLKGDGTKSEIPGTSSLPRDDDIHDTVPLEKGDVDGLNNDQEDTEMSPNEPVEPPGSPAKLGRVTSESASEREKRLKIMDQNEISKNEFLLDGGNVNGIHVEKVPFEEKKGDDEAMTVTRLTGSSVSQTNTLSGFYHQEIPFDNFECNEKTHETEFIQSTPNREVTENIFDNEYNVAKSRQPNHSSNVHLEVKSQTTNSLSPDSFLADHESFPIPHLPPLSVPGIRGGASYDSMSMQKSNQILHLGHLNSYQPPPILHQMSSFGSVQQPQPGLPIPHQVTTMQGGKRKIHLQLWENVSALDQPEKSSFLSFGRRKGILRKHTTSASYTSNLGDRNHSANESSKDVETTHKHWTDRGTLTVSWYEGTTSIELQEHVQNSVIRKLGRKSTTKLFDFRVLDESSNPPEEIVLSPFIPNNSRLTLRFAISNGSGELTPPKYTRFSDYDNGPPDSPSAAPSPYPTSLDLNGLGLNANQLALLGTRLNTLQVPVIDSVVSNNRSKLKRRTGKEPSKQQPGITQGKNDGKEIQGQDDDEEDNASKGSNLEVASLHPEDQIQKSLREITSLLLKERVGIRQHYVPRQEKRQVIFVLANYFVLFLSIIAISAEIQARAPEWHAAMEQQLKNVQDCSKDKESLLQCVENGDMAGLVASVILWLSRSAATKRIFLLGFKSPHKLWTAVYESLVTAFCWGFSYMFIRRGMNPDNNRDFLRRYWKDAVYGSLAGFNAAFMKQVMKNLIPQEVIEDALQERRLKILSWLPSH